MTDSNTPDILARLIEEDRDKMQALLDQVKAQDAAALAELQGLFDDKAQLDALLEDMRRQDAQVWQSLGLPQPTARKHPKRRRPRA